MDNCPSGTADIPRSLVRIRSVRERFNGGLAQLEECFVSNEEAGRSKLSFSNYTIIQLYNNTERYLSLTAKNFIIL